MSRELQCLIPGEREEATEDSRAWPLDSLCGRGKLTCPCNHKNCEKFWSYLDYRHTHLQIRQRQPPGMTEIKITDADIGM